MVASALVGSRLDYANSVLYGTTQKNISKLQKAQSLLARVVTCSPRSSQSSSYNLLQHLHWLPIKHRIILLVPSGSQTPICYALYSFVLHLAPAVSVLQLLKSGTLSLGLFECVPAMILSAINSRPTTSSWPSNQVSASSLAPQIRLWLTIVRVYKLYLLTYLLTYIFLQSHCVHISGDFCQISFMSSANFNIQFLTP